MAFREDLEALSTNDIDLTGDGWGPKVSALLAKLLPAPQEMARAVEQNKAEIDTNATAAAESDLSNVSESDLVRRILNNPASLPNGTLLQVRDGLIEPLAQDTLNNLITIRLSADKPELVAVGETQEFDYRIGTFPSTAPDSTIYPDSAYGAALAAFWQDAARANQERIIVSISRFAGSGGGETTTNLSVEYRIVLGVTT